MSTSEQDSKIDAIRAIVAAMDANQDDADGFTRLLTEDVALVNLAGRRVFGREALRRAMSDALQTPMANVRTRNELVDVRFPRPGIAVASCIKHVSDERDPSAKDPDASWSGRGSLTLMLVEEQDGWRIALAQTTPITA
ncbi:MAG TPA: SgcJ/EcaC family oxidoreductase [Solirubrobacteraceae bacterium]|nr:SgcJ/EcaC family oxidoreductase [Solirubrobacteraceae bacterium]